MGKAHKKSSAISESQLILIGGLLSFFNALDFSIVLPMAPDFAKDLGITLNQMGLVGAAYTLAGAVSGLLVGPFIDQYPRKRMLLIALAGLVAATLLCAGAWNLASMFSARLIAGFFGGVLYSANMALIVDFVPEQRRGSALGRVATGHALATILGISAGLAISEFFGWRATLVMIALFGLAILVFSLFKIPHREIFAVREKRVKVLLGNFAKLCFTPPYLVSFVMVLTPMLGHYMVTINMSGHALLNLNLPRENLSMFYLAGGVFGYLGMRLAGKISDGLSSTMSMAGFSLAVVAASWLLFIGTAATWLLIPLFSLYLFGAMGRHVSMMALTSKLPKAEERGAFISLQSSVIYISASVAGFGVNSIVADTGHSLENMDIVGWIVIVTSIVACLFCVYIETAYRRAKKAPVEEMVVEAYEGTPQ